MSIKFKPQVNFDSEDQKKLTRSIRPKPSYDYDFNSSQSVVLKKQTKQKDILLANKISKNDFFADEDAIFGSSNHSQIIVDQVKTQTIESKSPVAKRKKVSTSIKLQPLQTLQLKKNVQKIQFIQPPPQQIFKLQSEPIPPTQFSHLAQQLQMSKTLSSSSVFRSNLLNFEMNSSSSDEEAGGKELGEIEVGLGGKNQGMGNSSSMLFFEEEEDHHSNRNRKKVEQKKPELKQLKFKRTLKKKAQSANEAKQTAQNQQIKKPQDIIFNQQPRSQQQRQNSQNQQHQAKVGIQAEPNPQHKPQNPSSQQSPQQKPPINTVQHQKGVNFDTMKRLILSQIQKYSVLNLRLMRSKSILNFFSPQFRLQFFEDKHFVMGCKKTSSKPTSTFIFTCSEFNFQQTSKKYMGKMKSNIAGTVYNIFGPGMNPSNARSYNVPPRQLLATVVYRTQLFGTGRPKQFTIFIKKQDFLYYRDFVGVKMYDDQVPLHELYYNHPQNMGRMHILHTRRPTYFKQTKEYVMNFEGKVKKSSIKNFIVEDRDNSNAKAMLFGKVSDDEYVLDVLGPLSPIVGIGAALTVFDTRMGSD